MIPTPEVMTKLLKQLDTGQITKEGIIQRYSMGKSTLRKKIKEYRDSINQGEKA